MIDYKPCGNCGYLLGEAERKSMREFNGKMWSDVLDESLEIILTQAYMAGQASAGIDPSYSNALEYFNKCKVAVE